MRTTRQRNRSIDGSFPTEDLPVEAVEWIEQHHKLNVAPLVPSAVAGVKRLLDDTSELNELWQSNKKLYPKWKSQITTLGQRLEKAALKIKRTPSNKKPENKKPIARKKGSYGSSVRFSKEGIAIFRDLLKKEIQLSASKKRNKKIAIKQRTEKK